MPRLNEAASVFAERFGGGAPPAVLSVPGRVNLIGEHIDYHNLPVLPMAIQRNIQIAFRPRPDRIIRAVSSAAFGEREFAWTSELEPGVPGDWENYLKAAAQAVSRQWDLEYGIDAAVASDLPAAAGLSSSSALLTGITLALLQANGVHASFEELMRVLPEGEHFVGTRGGGMDHAAVLASRAGCALLVDFDPIAATPIPIPDDWAFLVAHSLTTAEKSGAVRARYNNCRTAGDAALQRLGFASFRAAAQYGTFDDLAALAAGHLSGQELRSFVHVTGEAQRVRDAVAALRKGDAAAFGRLLTTSHESLRDQLQISTAQLDALVEKACEAGALGARLTGGGFGGYAVILCHKRDREHIRAEIVRRYYAGQEDFDTESHLLNAEPSAGALFV